MTSPEMRRFAREFEQLKRSLRLQGSTPQLGTSSIEDGKIEEYVDGELKQVIGTQADGTNTTIQVNGPTPPAPSKPGIILLNEAATIAWDGLWADNAVAPLDLARIDVHFVDDPEDDPLESPARTTISSAGWGQASLPMIPGTYYAVLVAWTTSGKRAASPLSDPFTVEPFTVDLSELEDELGDLQGALTTLQGLLDGLQDAQDSLSADLDDAEAQIAAALADIDGILPITETKISDGAISTAKIQANAVTADQVSANAITAAKVAAGAITAIKIASHTITAAEIAAGTITASEIAAGTITATEIATNAITANKILAGAITAGKIATDAVEANNIKAGAIKTDKLDAGAVTADKVSTEILVTGSIYTREAVQVGDPAGANMRVGSDGLRAYGSGGSTTEPTTMIDSANGLFTAVNARIKGLLEGANAILKSLTLTGASRVDRGSSVTVAGGIVAPPQAPTMSREWPSVATALAGDFAPIYRGFLLNAAGNGWLVTSAFFGNSFVGRLNLDGSSAGSALISWSNFHAEGGITRIGSTYYVLGVDTSSGTSRSGKWYVKRLNSSFVEVGEWEVGFTTAPPRRPAIGTDGTDILIGRVAPSGGTQFVIVNRWNPTTGAYQDDKVVQAMSSPTDVTSVNVREGRYLVGFQGSVRAYSTLSGLRDTSYEFLTAGSANMLGLGFDGTRYRHLDAQGTMWTYSTLAADTVRSVDFSWRDADPAGTGTHETGRGPAASYTQVARSWLRVKTAEPYDDGSVDSPDSVRIWIDGYRQADLGASSGSTPAVTTALYEIPSTANNSPDASFATANLSAAWIGPELPGWKLWGNGVIDVPSPTLPSHAVPYSMISRHHIRRHATGGQGIGAGATILAQFNTEGETPMGSIVASNSNSRFTVGVAGTYSIQASVTPTTNSSAMTFTGSILKNGTTVRSNRQMKPASSGTVTAEPGVTLALLPGDYIEVAASSTVATSLSTAAEFNALSIVRTGP